MLYFKSLIFFIFTALFTCFSLIAEVELLGVSATFEVSALHLISPKRADVMAKYIYAKQREWGSRCRFGHDIYYRHLQAWNGFYEDEPLKRSFDDFIDAFDTLLDSIKINFSLSCIRQPIWRIQCLVKGVPLTSDIGCAISVV